MKVQGQFKMQTHHSPRGVVMDIAAFKVSLSVGTDIDATALRAARGQGQAPSIGAVVKAQGKFKMEELSEKVQNASTHMLRRQNHDRAQQAVKFQGDGCKFKMQMHLSGVGMDIAAFKVSHSAVTDIDATAL
jgi:hypothetical protein